MDNTGVEIIPCEIEYDDLESELKKYELKKLRINKINTICQ